MILDIFIFFLVITPAVGVLLAQTPLRCLQWFFFLGLSFNVILLRLGFIPLAAIMVTFYSALSLLFLPHIIFLFRGKKGSTSFRMSRNFIGLSTLLILILLGVFILVIDDNYEFLIESTFLYKVKENIFTHVHGTFLKKYFVPIELFAIFSLTLVLMGFLIGQAPEKGANKGQQR